MPRGGVRRKLYAKLRPDEQEAHRGDGTRARGHENLKPKVIRRVPAYMRQVDGAKVARLTLGGLSSCPGYGGVLPALRGAGRERQKSAEAVVVGVTDRQRAEHAVPEECRPFDGDERRRRRG